MTEEEAISKAEEIVMHDILPLQDDTEGLTQMTRQIEKILRMYTCLGEQSESIGTLQNSVGWLVLCMNRSTLEQQERGIGYCYQKGQLRQLIGMEKMRIGYNQSHRKCPDTMAITVKDLDVAKVSGLLTDWDDQGMKAGKEWIALLQRTFN